jgi:hypothetical protein
MEDITVCPLSAGNPCGRIHEIVVVPVIDILHGSIKTGSMNSTRIQVFSHHLERKIRILDAAVHMGINNHGCSLL